MYLKRAGEKAHPCRTPEQISKNGESRPLELTGIRKEATILSMKKAGKPPGAISSYRPTNGLTMERIVQNRLYNQDSPAETYVWKSVPNAQPGGFIEACFIT